MPERKKTTRPRKDRVTKRSRVQLTPVTTEPAAPVVPSHPTTEIRPLLPQVQSQARLPNAKRENAISDLATDWTLGFLNAFEQVQSANLEFFNRSLEFATSASSRLFGFSSESRVPEDRRFKDDAWNMNPFYQSVKESYLISSQWLLDLADTWKDIDPELHHRARFYTKLFTEAASPANSPWTNPLVVQETIRTGGANLSQGAINLVGDMVEGRISQVPEGTFQLGRDIGITPGKVVFRNRLIELIQYLPNTDQVHAVPVLIVPPWINKYYVLDLRPKNSLVKFLVDSGYTVFIVSWKNADSSMRNMTWEDYMSLGVLDSIRSVKEIAHSDRVNMVGYCVGGILLETVLAHWAAKADETANTASFLAVHQDFDNVGDMGCFISPPEVNFLEWLMSASGGYLDGKNMGLTFDLMRSNDLIWSYVVNNYLMGKGPAAFDILSWNADHTRVPEALHSFYLREFFLKKQLTRPNGLHLLGTDIDVRKIQAPTFILAMIEDHIVPWKSAFKMRETLSGPIRFTLAESGHIAGVLNPPAAKARGYWSEDCDTPDPEMWLHSCSEKHQGSWWPDWVEWLAKFSGKMVSPPGAGSAEYPPIMDAPGTYVKEN